MKTDKTVEIEKQQGSFEPQRLHLRTAVRAGAAFEEEDVTLPDEDGLMVFGDEDLDF